MADLKKLAAHFNKYQKSKGVDNVGIIDTNIEGGNIKLFAAEVPTIQQAETAVKAPQHPAQEQSPVLDSVEDLGGTVTNEVEKKMNLQVRRVIEDAVRRYLGPVFQQLETAIKPQVEKEVAEQSQEVKQDIKEVVPAMAKVEETAVAAPKTPAAPLTEAASLHKAATQSIIVVRNPTNFFASEIQEKFGIPVEENLADKSITIATTEPTPITEWLTQQQADWHISDLLSEPLPEEPITQEVPLQETQVINPEPQNEPNLIQSNLNTAREEIRVSGNQEETDMLKISYHQGESFDKSYFVATEGKVTKCVSASRVIPAEVQQAIREAEEKGVEATGILSPEEAAVEIEKASNGTLEGFNEFAKSLPKLTREADLKRESEWAINEGEIAKVDMPKDGEVIMSVKPDEVEATDLPSGTSSKVKSYFAKLPSKAVGGQENAINPQSSVNEKYNLLRKALEIEKAKVEDLSKEKEQMGGELKQLKEKDDVDQKRGKVSSIMGALKKLGPVDPENEKTAVDMLVKIDGKALAALLDVLKLVAGEEGKGDMPMFGAPKEAPKSPAMPPLPGMPKAPKASMNGINLPQIGASHETTSLIDVVSQMMDH